MAGMDHLFLLLGLSQSLLKIERDTEPGRERAVSGEMRFTLTLTLAAAPKNSDPSLVVESPGLRASERCGARAVPETSNSNDIRTFLADDRSAEDTFPGELASSRSFGSFSIIVVCGPIEAIPL